MHSEPVKVAVESPHFLPCVPRYIFSVGKCTLVHATSGLFDSVCVYRCLRQGCALYRQVYVKLEARRAR
jgi:hypothetical protein